MNLALRIAACIALASITSWAFFGFPWWAPVIDDPGRSFGLYMLHGMAIIGGAVAWISSHE